jgi:fructose-1,6-bisphosphatase/inositol monophosphatase family enzyme
MTNGFAQEMEVALRQAGAVARMLQGRVSDEGKDAGVHMPHDDDTLRRKRAAKTLADEVVQEILLVAALPLLDAHTVAVDAEEDTPSTARFAAFGNNDGQSLILDPIDGTLEYLAGDDIYSICIGLVRSGVMATAIVYFAARDVCYALDETGQSFVAHNFSIHGWQHAQELSTVRHQGQRIYANGRVEDEVLSRLREHGYQVIDDTEMPGGAPDCILTCLTGESLGYISHTRQVRDVLLGAIVAGAHGGQALTWEGTPLTWPEKGRVERAIFLGSALPEDLVECLLTRT